MLGGRVPQIGDTEDAVVMLLEIIANNTGGFGGGIREGDVTIEQAGGGSDLAYISTGPGGVVIPPDWDDIELGLTARVVSFRRFDIPIQVAFLNPNDRGSWIIPLDPEEKEDPFTIGDSYGLNATTVWIRADPSVDYDALPDEPAVHFIGYR